MHQSVALLTIVATISLSSAWAQGDRREAVVPKTTASDASAAPTGPALSYRIGAGDVLQITVWKEPDLSVPATPVRADGTVSVPLLGEIAAAGLTPKEFENVLRAKLQPIVLGAQVFVLVKEVHSEKVYVIGAVKKEGSIPISSAMTVLQVLAEAGGLTDFAKSRKIYILRATEKGEKMFPFDYEAVVRGLNREQNIYVRPGDTVVVPR